MDAATISENLPTPADRPKADIVIFDGHCRFCTQQVRRLNAWDSRDRLAYMSLHDPEVYRRFPGLTHEQLMQQMYVIDQQGNRYGGATAFRYLTRRLPRLWLLAPLLHMPFSLPLWQWGYKQVAKRRFKMGRTDICDDGACEVHLR